MMGGVIDVHSLAGAGSTFWFEVPLEAVAPPAPVASRNDPLGQPTTRPLRILVAEDNFVNQDIICSVLESHGHRIALASNGNEAVDAFEAETFDIVLMDVQMPDLNGLAATAAIRALEAREGRGRTPILALTADVMVTDRAKCRAAGMDACITKPIDWPELCAAIEALTTRPPQDAAAGSPVLDEAILEELAKVVGRARVGAYLRDFPKAVEACIGGLRATDSASERIRHLHNIVSCAGHLGFVELRHTAGALQKGTRSADGEGVLRELGAAAARALDAAATTAWADCADRTPARLAS